MDKGKKHETLPTFTEFYCLFPQSLFANLFKVFKIIWNWDIFEMLIIFVFGLVNDERCIKRMMMRSGLSQRPIKSS